MVVLDIDDVSWTWLKISGQPHPRTRAPQYAQRESVGNVCIYCTAYQYAISQSRSPCGVGDREERRHEKKCLSGGLKRLVLSYAVLYNHVDDIMIFRNY